MDSMKNYNFEGQDENTIAYEIAYKRVKRIKSFYTHLAVYILVNLFLVGVNYRNLEIGESYFQWHNFTTAFFWGIGLVAHAFSVFAPNFILGDQWEERKIKEIMDKEKNEKWE
jgi:hypothetical protein